MIPTREQQLRGNIAREFYGRKCRSWIARLDSPNQHDFLHRLHMFTADIALRDEMQRRWTSLCPTAGVSFVLWVNNDIMAACCEEPLVALLTNLDGWAMPWLQHNRVCFDLTQAVALLVDDVPFDSAYQEQLEAWLNTQPPVVGGPRRVVLDSQGG